MRPTSRLQKLIQICAVLGSLPLAQAGDDSTAPIDIESDALNCGQVGNVCFARPLDHGTAVCMGGVCHPVCDGGWSFDPNKNDCIDTTSDVVNCGGVDHRCPRPVLGQPLCVQGRCDFFCEKGYVKHDGKCMHDFQAPEVAEVNKKKKKKKRSNGVTYEPCPETETACPIREAASFEWAVSHGIATASQVEFSAFPIKAGGYECLDTMNSLNSCGGCASTGAGKDCNSIPNVIGVGCEAGSCIIFSCEEGFRPSLSGSECVKSATLGRRRKSHHRKGHFHGAHGGH